MDFQSSSWQRYNEWQCPVWMIFWFRTKHKTVDPCGHWCICWSMLDFQGRIGSAGWIGCSRTNCWTSWSSYRFPGQVLKTLGGRDTDLQIKICQQPTCCLQIGSICWLPGNNSRGSAGSKARAARRRQFGKSMPQPNKVMLLIETSRITWCIETLWRMTCSLYQLVQGFFHQ